MADLSPKILHCRSEADAPRGFPRFSGSPSPARLIAIAQAMKPYDLVVTHGFDAINVALAHKVFGQHLGLPPLIHHEQGSVDFEALETRWKRKTIRRIALGSVHTLVTPAKAIGDFAARHWSVPKARIAQIRPGIDLKRFRPGARPDALPGLVKRSTEHWIGAYLESAHHAAAAELVEALQDLPTHWHLVLIAGATPADAIRAIADQHELSHRVHVLGSVVDEAKTLALCDLYVDLTGPYEHAPGAMMAMAAATPVIAASGDGLQARLDDLILDAQRRDKEAKDNRIHALAQFDSATCAAALDALYRSAIAA